MTSVGIIGAGPVGTSQALALLRAGFEVTLFEREAHLPADPRAATLQPPTLEMLTALGSGAAIVEQGLQAPVFQFRDRQSDTVIAEYDYGRLASETDFPFALQCEQFKVADANVQLIETLAPGTVQFATTIIGFAQDANGVTVSARGPGGDDTHRFDYLIGCDGNRSATRKMLGIAFEGFTYANRFLVLSTPHDFYRHGYRTRNNVLDPDRWCALYKVPHKGPPGLWRIVLPAPPVDVDVTTDAYVADQIGGIDSALRLTDIHHRNIYSVNQRVAARFHKGRVFLAGDSAHVNNPLGGLGMNSGIHDAINLTEKLVAARDRPEDADAFFDAYTRERRGIATGYVQAQSMRNKARIEARTPEDRKATIDALRADADDAARHRHWVMEASLIKGLRDLAAGSV
ncbi:FAD-dependent oxidoreductase [Roseivivax sp. CAU 1753]